MQIPVISRGYHTAMVCFRSQLPRDLAIRQGQVTLLTGYDFVTPVNAIDENDIEIGALARFPTVQKNRWQT